jgi:enamine deaminase RidA (YjgF/YER057c/UK114 family)
MKYKRFIDAAGGWEPFQGVLNAVSNAARQQGVSMANIACRYILEQPAVGGIIIGARPGVSRHIEDNARLFEFTIDPASRTGIETALENMQPIPGDCGDEYRRPPFLTASGDLSHHFQNMPLQYEPVKGADGRSRVFSGTSWEEMAGYCRAVCDGRRIYVSGTTATHGDRLIGGDDAAAQCHFIIDKIQGAIESLGGRLEDVVRTRIFIRNMVDWEAVAGAHGERFRHIRPANTLVQADLVGEEYLVEMEADAVLGV